MSTKNVGDRGEKIALSYLLTKGYKILQKNWYCNHGEIDIIAQINKTIVFIEVKYRKNENYGFTSEAFGYKKRNHLRRSIGIFLSKYKLWGLNYQVDLLYITASQFTHYKNVLL